VNTAYVFCKTDVYLQGQILGSKIVQHESIYLFYLNSGIV